MYRLILLACAGLAGCTVIPGMHVGMSGGDISHSKDISDHEQIRYLESPTGAIAALRIITVTPQTLVAAELERRPQPSALSAVEPGVPAREYRIGPGDVVNVIVWEHPELTNPTGEFRDAVSAGRLVDAQGMMYYPYLGAFSVAGMTVAELREHIEKNLARVIAKPQVDARVVAFRSQRVQVTGAVRQPGLVSLDDTPKGIVEALNERGGLAEAASQRRVELTRGGQRYSIDIAALFSGAQTAPNPLLMPGDLLHVPDRSGDQVFVLGEVNKEGPVYLQQQRTTLTEALAAAGGMNRTGSDDTGVLVFRRPTGDDRMATVYRVDLSDAIGLLAAGEFGLEPRDVVYVSSTGFSQYNAVINQLLPTISAIFQVDALVRRGD